MIAHNITINEKLVMINYDLEVKNKDKDRVREYLKVHKISFQEDRIGFNITITSGQSHDLADYINRVGVYKIIDDRSAKLNRLNKPIKRDGFFQKLLRNITSK